MSHTSTMIVRFSETDGQGVVFNGSYPVYADAAFDAWLEAVRGRAFAWDVGRNHAVAAKSTWNFRKSAKYLDRIEVKCSVSRWGNTSFDVTYDGTVDGEACFDGVVTYVCVDSEHRRPVEIPKDLRNALSSTPRAKM
ncbi:unnamed product [Ostreococcus tauri]|uniref:Unnamed product n=2 Tax=Ostreococcus tauri TaxID=70448 RepID=A0A090LXH7_OSTTA|nr:unnamed product [Ostreococcus tauri]CEF96511.1 unnamed product [Ostreococcus tauri]|eukprot:XP_003074123.2 unnamed product [Ostreococcus tauri]